MASLSPTTAFGSITNRLGASGAFADSTIVSADVENVEWEEEDAAFARAKSALDARGFSANLARLNGDANGDGTGAGGARASRVRASRTRLRVGADIVSSRVAVVGCERARK
jgi:hypothetical protein